MSYAAIDWAMAQAIPDINAKFCLVVLAHHQNDKTGLCCPSITTIAEKMGVKSVNTVKKAIKTLVAADLVSYSRVLGVSGEIVRTEYKLNFSNREGVGHDVTEGISPRDGGVYQTVTGGRSSCDGGVHQSVTGVGYVVTPNKELTRNNNIESNKVCETTLTPSLENLVPDVLENGDTSKKAASSKKKGTRLTIDALPDDWRKYCEEHASDIDAQKAFEDFHDYWVGVPGAKGVKLDWFATWRNFLRGIPDWKRKNFVKSTKPTGRLDTTSAEYLEIYRRGCTYDPNAEPSPTDADGFVAF